MIKHICVFLLCGISALTVNINFETIMILVNVSIRILYPSSYCPASRSTNSFLASPILARTLATIAEIGYYRTQIYAVLGDNLTDVQYLMRFVYFGECLSWACVLLQSEFLGFAEDSLWAILNIILMSYYTKVDSLYYSMMVFVIYMFLFHLPTMFYNRVLNRNSKLINVPYKESVCEQDFGTKLWWYPSLILQVLSYILYNMYLN